jgi:hypothetical protein
MILGMTPFALIHVLISLAGILSGLIVIRGFLHSLWLDGWNRIFLVTTALTSMTGFFFPFDGKVLPSHILGVISLLVLIPVVYAWAAKRLSGGWRTVYVVGSVAAEYFNCFVLVVQLFLKVPALHALAPSGNEPAFAGAQGALLLLFLWLGWRSTKQFHPE